MHCAYKTKKQLTYVNCFLWCAGRDSPSAAALPCILTGLAWSARLLQLKTVYHTVFLTLQPSRVTKPKRRRWRVQRGEGRESYKQTRLRSKLPQDATITFQGNRRFRVPLSQKTKNPTPKRVSDLFGALEGTRTPDPLIRSQVLYPAELPAQSAILY